MLTITDLFCGGGGSSTGAIQIPGVEIKIAANHLQLAVDVHNQNHPDADHAAVDLHEEDPRYFPRTDILWASPECTKWSQASGGTVSGSTTGTSMANGSPSRTVNGPAALSTGLVLVRARTWNRASA